MATRLESRLSTQVLARWCSVRQENLGNPRLLVGGPEETPSVVFGGIVNGIALSSSQARVCKATMKTAVNAQKNRILPRNITFTFTQAVMCDVAGA